MEKCQKNKQNFMKTPVWVVKKVIANSDYTLTITFASGEIKKYNALPLLEKPIFAELKNLPFFLLAKVDGDTVVWNEDIDIAPEHLYECSVLI